MLGAGNENESLLPHRGRTVPIRASLLIPALGIVTDRLLTRNYDSKLDSARRALQASLEFTTDPERETKDVIFWAKFALRAINQLLGPQPSSPTTPFSAQRVAEAILSGIDLRDCVQQRRPGVTKLEPDPNYDDELQRARGYILDALGAAA